MQLNVSGTELKKFAKKKEYFLIRCGRFNTVKMVLFN